MARALISGDFGIEEPLRVIPPKPRAARAAWYKPNHRSFGAFIRSEQMRDVTADVAQDIAATASATVPAPHADTDPDRVVATYSVVREAGLIKVSGNLRVRVFVHGDGEGVERAEFGGPRNKRYRNLAKAASKFGDWRVHRDDE